MESTFEAQKEVIAFCCFHSWLQVCKIPAGEEYERELTAFSSALVGLARFSVVAADGNLLSVAEDDDTTCEHDTIVWPLEMLMLHSYCRQPSSASSPVNDRAARWHRGPMWTIHPSTNEALRQIRLQWSHKYPWISPRFERCIPSPWPC